MGKTLITQNIWQATYFLAEGCKILKVRKNERNRVEFEFEQNDATSTELQQRYWDNETNVNLAKLRVSHGVIRNLVLQHR